MVFESIREHAGHCDFLRARAEIKNLLILRAASSLESTTREQQALLRLLIFSAFSNPYGNPFFKKKKKKENILKQCFNLEPTKFFEASLSDTLSRSNQLQSRLIPNDVTFSLDFTAHVFVWIRKQRLLEEQPYITMHIYSLD